MQSRQPTSIRHPEFSTADSPATIPNTSLQRASARWTSNRATPNNCFSSFRPALNDRTCDRELHSRSSERKLAPPRTTEGRHIFRIRPHRRLKLRQERHLRYANGRIPPPLTIANAQTFLLVLVLLSTNPSFAVKTPLVQWTCCPRSVTLAIMLIELKEDERLTLLESLRFSRQRIEADDKTPPVIKADNLRRIEALALKLKANPNQS